MPNGSPTVIDLAWWGPLLPTTTVKVVGPPTGTTVGWALMARPRSADAAAAAPGAGPASATTSAARTNSGVIDRALVRVRIAPLLPTLGPPGAPPAAASGRSPSCPAYW